MNPVLHKDLLGLLRLKRVAVIQLFFLLTLGLMILASWPQSGVLQGTIEAGNADTPTASIARSQDQLLLGLTIGQIVLLVLFVPGIAAVSLSGEREANTLEMLYASRLSPAQIILGKVGVATAFPMLMLISALPFAAMLKFRGGVAMDELAWAFVMPIATAIFLAMLCLTISAYTKQSSTALVISYVTVLIMTGGVLVPAAIMLDSASPDVAMILHYVRSTSAVAAALSLLSPETDFAGTGRGLMPLWQTFLPMVAIISAICFALLVAKLRKAPSSSDGFGAGSGSAAERSLGRKLLFLIDDKKKPKPFGHFNPVISKERRTSQLRSGRWMIRIFYVSLLVSLGLAVMALTGGDTEHANLLEYVAMVVVVFQLGIVALVAPSLTSSSISSEIEGGTWETLRLTPLGAMRIFLGKFLPAFVPALLPILALLPAYAALAYVNPAYQVYFLRILPVVGMSVIFCCTLGLTCSTLQNNTARATVMAYLLAAATFVLPMLAWWAAGQVLSVKLAAYIAFVSPMVVAVNTLPSGWGMINELHLYTAHLYLMGGLSLALLAVAWFRLNYLLKRG